MRMHHRMSSNVSYRWYFTIYYMSRGRWTAGNSGYEFPRILIRQINEYLVQKEKEPWWATVVPSEEPQQFSRHQCHDPDMHFTSQNSPSPSALILL